MKTLTLITALLLTAGLAKAQTRLETEFQSLEKTALAVDVKKAADEAARKAAEIERERQAAQEKTRQLYIAEAASFNAAIESKFKHQKVASIHTSMRTVSVGRYATTLDYILIITKLDNGMICQMGVHDENYDSRSATVSSFKRFAFCVSEEGTYSLTASRDLSTGKLILSPLGSLERSTDAQAEKKEWNKFSYLRQLDAAQDKAKKEAYSRAATITCLQSTFPIREALYKSSTDYENELRYSYSLYREPGPFDEQVSLLNKAIEKGTSLAALQPTFPGCFASAQ